MIEIFTINKHSKRCFTSLGSKASSEVTKGKFTKSLQLNLIRMPLKLSYINCESLSRIALTGNHHAPKLFVISNTRTTKKKKLQKKSIVIFYT